MRKKQEVQTVFDERKLREELKRSAKAIGLSTGAAEIIVERVARKVSERLAKRTVVTVDDVDRFVTAEAEKYSEDLAYVYRNRGKII